MREPLSGVGHLNWLKQMPELQRDIFYISGYKLFDSGMAYIESIEYIKILDWPELFYGPGQVTVIVLV